jgi:hypothetical protein
LVHVTKRPDGKYIGTFLTAKHVVDLNTPTTIVLRRPNDPRRYYARVKLETIKRHKTFDAAMFVVSGLPEIFAKPVPIASAAPTVGDWVLSSGYSTPTQREIHAGHVIVEGIKLPRFGQCFMSNGRIIRGMSGGPVLNRKGEAVGIVVAKDGDNEQYSVSLHALKAWLKRSHHNPPPQPRSHFFELLEMPLDPVHLESVMPRTLVQSGALGPTCEDARLVKHEQQVG